MASRSARVRALAKVNLSLKVLGLRPDGFHELRTVFQTISLADIIEIDFTPARRTSISVEANVAIVGENIVARAAGLVLEALKTSGRVEMRLTKRIPMGAGLGGGSSDAAAVLLTLPALAGRTLSLEVLGEAAGCLGSDVPFFLLGGTAVAVGRGTELYPLPERKPAYGLVVAPGIHVSTAQAYRDLDSSRKLTSIRLQNTISSFQSSVWQEGQCPSERAENDFEPVVFASHPRLSAVKRQLKKVGGSPALLSGSGSALFAVFDSREQAAEARASFGKEQVFPIRFVNRAAYRALWRRQLESHIAGKVWPPQSRYV